MSRVVRRNLGQTNPRFALVHSFVDFVLAAAALLRGGLASVSGHPYSGAWINLLERFFHQT